MRITSLPSTKNSTNNQDDGFNVEVGPPKSDLSTLVFTQKVRTGTPDMSFMVCSTDEHAGLIVAPNGVAAACQVVEIAAGRYNLPTNAKPSFRPTGNGMATVQITPALPEIIVTDAGTVNIDVSGFGLVLNIPDIGAGLQRAVSLSRTGSTNTAVDASLTTTTPSLCQLSLVPNASGSSSLPITFAAGQAAQTVWIQGQDGATGACQIQATTVNYAFTPASPQANMVTPGVQIVLLPPGVDYSGDNVDFQIQVGVPSADGSVLAEAQQVRYGREFTFTVRVLYPAYAQLLSSIPPSPGTAVTVKISQQTYQNTGLLQFDPIAEGLETVTIDTNPEVSHTTAADKEVQVYNPSSGGC